MFFWNTVYMVSLLDFINSIHIRTIEMLALEQSAEEWTF